MPLPPSPIPRGPTLSTRQIFSLFANILEQIKNDYKQFKIFRFNRPYPSHKGDLLIVINLSYSEFFYQPPPRCCRSICLSPRGLTVSRTLAPCPHVVGPQCLTMMPFIIRSPLEHLHLSSGPTTPWTLVNSLSMYHIHFIKCHI